MQALVGVVLCVLELDLQPLGDRLVKQLDVVEDLLVVGFVGGRLDDVLHARGKVYVGQSAQLLYELLALPVGNMRREHHAVHQQAQLAVRKLVIEVEIREDMAFLLLAVCLGVHADGIAVLDVVAELDQIHQVALDGLAVGFHLVFALQDIDDIVLSQTVVLVGVLAEDVKDVDDQQLFRRFGIHVSSPR